MLFRICGGMMQLMESESVILTLAADDSRSRRAVPRSSLHEAMISVPADLPHRSILNQQFWQEFRQGV